MEHEERVEVSRYIERYKIDNLKNRCSIFLKRVIRYLDVEHQDKYHLSDLLPNLLFLIENPDQVAIDTFSGWIEDHLKYFSPSVVALIKENLALKNTGFFQRVFPVMLILKYCEISGIPLLDFTKEVESLIKIRNPNLRNKIRVRLFDWITAAQKATDKFANLKELKSNALPAYLSLPVFYLLLLKEQGGNLETVSRIAASFRSSTTRDNHIFKEANAAQALLEALEVLVEDKSLSVERKLALLEIGLEGNDRVEITRRLSWMVSIHGLRENLSSLSEIKSPVEIERELFAAFQERIPIRAVENFPEKYANTFQRFRHPTALLVYAGRLRSFYGPKKEVLLEKLAEFTTRVLNGTFIEERYENSPHLGKVFSDCPELKEKWKKRASSPLKEFLQEIKDKTVLWNFKKLLKRSFSEGHARGQTFILLPRLLAGENFSPSEETLSDFEAALIRLTEAKNEEEAVATLKECKEKIPASLQASQFNSDLSTWLYSLEHPKKVNDHWIIVNTDDPCDLLLSGTEVFSCQSVNADSRYNVSLLSYLLDGKNGLIAIKNEAGQLEARAIFRLLWDGEKPVLFLERIYPALLEEPLKEAILQFAKEKAKAMNLPLYSKEVGEGAPSDKTLESLGGPAPYEYVDAYGGDKLDSIWSISDTYLVE